MSDIPELDRLLDEADTVRHSRMMDRADLAFVTSMKVFFTAIILMPLAILGGEQGAYGLTGFLLSGLAYSIWPCLSDIASMFFWTPPRRDPTKRYVSK